MQPQPKNQELSPASFAGLLSALTASKAQHSRPSSAESWTHDLKDDVATLTYERALQSHAQYKNSEPASAEAEALHFASQSCAAAQSPLSRAAAESFRDRTTAPFHEQEKNPKRARKNASVTLRMSEAEHAQLQQRATETNLSVSAYLRSCTFEVEALRAQVKEALAEMRNQPAATQQIEPAGPRWLRMLRRPKSS